MPGSDAAQPGCSPVVRAIVLLLLLPAPDSAGWWRWWRKELPAGAAREASDQARLEQRRFLPPTRGYPPLPAPPRRALRRSSLPAAAPAEGCLRWPLWLLPRLLQLVLLVLESRHPSTELEDHPPSHAGN